MRTKIPRYGASVERGPITASVSIDINPLMRHVAEFVALKCAPDYLELGVLPRGTALKELTETLSAFDVVRRQLGPASFSDTTVTLVDVGCGQAPRTAAMFAFRTKWSTVAVDPLLKSSDRWESKINRLICKRERIEDVAVKVSGFAVITLVHAHVRVVDALRSIDADNYLVVAIPCCVPHELNHEAVADFADYGCLSPQRRVKVWKLDRGQRNRLISPSEVVL